MPRDPGFEDFSLPPDKTPGRYFLGAFLRLAGFLILLLMGIVLFLPVNRSARPAAARAQCVNNLKQIQIALSLYQDTHGSLPPAYSVGADGRPLHSWRVLILPYLDEADLYGRIELTKPWNDPVNAWAHERMPSVFRCPAHDSVAGLTPYLACVGPDAFLRTDRGRKSAEITDGFDRTLAVVEVPKDRSTNWMAPVDLSPMQYKALGVDAKWAHPGGSNASFADGSVRFLKANLSPEIKQGLMTVDGGEAISPDKY